MVKIICGACSKPLSIDETKLPMKEVSFPCPLCKTKLKVDRRELDLESGEMQRAEVADAGGAVQSAAPAAEVGPASVSVADAPASTGPKALIVGQSSPELQQAANALGYNGIHRPTAGEGRDYYLQEFPEIVFIAPETIAQPPMEDLIPITGVGPAERRRGFFILVGDNLRSLDGNAAFLYGVNLVVAKKELGAISRIYQDARRDHDRLTRAFIQLVEE